MEYKTSSPDFLKYGSPIRNVGLFKEFDTTNIEVVNSSFDFIYHNSKGDVYINKTKGITFIEISDDGIHFDSFVINGITKINRNKYFNFITLSEKGGVCFINVEKKEVEIVKLSKPYYHKKSLPTFEVTQIYYCSYSYKSEGYYFDAHNHPIFELTYVDSGILNSTVDGKRYCIKKNQYIIYASNQVHTQAVTEDHCSYLTLTFMLNTTKNYCFENYVYKADEYLINLFRTIIELDKKDEMFADFSVLKLKEILIISYLKRKNKLLKTSDSSSYDRAILMSIIEYVEENLHMAITIEDICYKFGISRSFVQRLFKSELDITPKKYILRKKLEIGRILLKEGKKSISDVAYSLGFTANYFTRVYKNVYGITPRKSIESVYDIFEK